MNTEKKEESRNVLKAIQKRYDCLYSIGDLTPTICCLFGIPEPDCCGCEVIPEIADQADKLMGGEGKTQRAVLFCADALGENQRQHFPEDFDRIQKIAGFRIQSVSVIPSVTPVCYGTIFTGAAPCVHGIQKYEKPVIQIETLFDVFAKAGKRIAVISCCDCSIDTIFRKRKVDYFSFHDNHPNGLTDADERAIESAKRFIQEDSYDLIIVYMANYDHQMHLHGPFSAECAEQAHLAAKHFQELKETMDAYWKQYNRVLTFVPDHGGHSEDEIHGGHGSDLREDMIVNHYYRIDRGE